MATVNAERPRHLIENDVQMALMKLVTVHKILIRTAIGGGALFCAWSVYQWTQSGESSALIMAAVSAGATTGMGMYLRQFIRKDLATTQPAE